MKISFGGGSLWRDTIDARHGVAWGGWCFKEVSEGYGVGLWKYIRKGGHVLQIKFALQLVRAVISDFGGMCGVESRLWKGFFRPYTILQLIGKFQWLTCIYSLMVRTWNILFNRDFHDCELPIVSKFFSLLYFTEIPLTQRDSLKWRSNNHKLCTVKAYLAS